MAVDPRQGVNRHGSRGLGPETESPEAELALLSWRIEKAGRGIVPAAMPALYAS